MNTFTTLRRALVIGTITATTITMAACGGSSSSSSSGSGKQVTLALSTLNNPFFISVRDGAQAEANAKGIKLNVVDAQNDPATQANQLANAQTTSQAGVIINPVDSDAATSAVKPLLTSKIPVVAVDRSVTGITPTSFIASDNVAGGKQAADAMAAAIGNKGKILVLDGTSGTSAARDRGQGFANEIKKFPGISIVGEQTANFDRTTALNVTTNLLQGHPDVTAIFAANDEMALGAVKALGSKAGKTVKVFGFDGTADGLKAVQAGTMAGTIAQQPSLLGKDAVDQIVNAINGQSVSATVPVEVKTVTSSNVASFLK